MPKVCQTYAQSMPKVCQKYSKCMPQICQKYIQSMPKVSQKYATSILKVRHKYAETISMPQMSKSIPTKMKKNARIMHSHFLYTFGILAPCFGSPKGPWHPEAGRAKGRRKPPHRVPSPPKGPLGNPKYRKSMPKECRK